MLSDSQIFFSLRRVLTTSTQIWGFRDDYEFLSHFYPASVKAYGVMYPTVEHAFQASMTLDKTWREKIYKSKSPRQVKFFSHQMPVRPDKEEVKLTIVYTLDYRKFTNHPKLLEKLIETGDRLLVEGNVWHDNFWGDCQCCACKNIEGLNWSGKILMSIRKKLKEN